MDKGFHSIRKASERRYVQALCNSDLRTNYATKVTVPPYLGMRKTFGKRVKISKLNKAHFKNINEQVGETDNDRCYYY